MKPARMNSCMASLTLPTENNFIMFTFFSRKKKIVIDAFTFNETIYNLAPIVKTSKVIPNWWKKLPNFGPGNVDDNPETGKVNIKTCYGFVELFHNGFVIPNWSDTHFRVNSESVRWWTKNFRSPQIHDRSQYEGAFTKSHVPIKIPSPWIMREKTGVKFVSFGATWHHCEYNFKVLPGFLDFQLSGTTNVFMVFNKTEKEYDEYVPLGLPLVHVIPITDCRIEIKNHIVSMSEFDSMIYTNLSFRSHFHLLKKMNRKSVDCEENK